MCVCLCVRSCAHACMCAVWVGMRACVCMHAHVNEAPYMHAYVHTLAYIHNVALLL